MKFLDRFFYLWAVVRQNEIYFDFYVAKRESEVLLRVFQASKKKFITNISCRHAIWINLFLLSFLIPNLNIPMTRFRHPLFPTGRFLHYNARLEWSFLLPSYDIALEFRRMSRFFICSLFIWSVYLCNCKHLIFLFHL